MKKHHVINFILVLLTLVIAGTSIWLPGFLLKRESKSMAGTVNEVPPQYYSGPSDAIIKNASTQLTSEQRIQLITGIWDSTISEVKPEDCNITEFGIRTIVLNHIEILHSKGLYPKSLSSATDEWYSWSATPYRALDTTFKTYAAFYWDITFTKYDNSEIHRFIATESGDILYASATMNGEDNLKSFVPIPINCSYMMFYFGDNSNTTYNAGQVRITTQGNDTTTYRTSTPTDAVKTEVDTSVASSFIPDFEPFKPDNVYLLAQSVSSSGIKNVFYVPYIKNDTSYSILLIPANDNGN